MNERLLTFFVASAVQFPELFCESFFDCCETGREFVGLTTPSVVPGQMNCCRGQVVQDRASSRKSGGDAGHTRTAERIEDDVTRLGVVLDERLDRLRRHFGV